MDTFNFGERPSPPGPILAALESRAPLELAATLTLMPFLRLAPTGDGHPVLVIPGLATTDISTIVLRWYLSDCRYAAHRWHLGTNVGPLPGVMEACRSHVTELRRRYGRKVSLIGWSLGGIYARETAKAVPEDVRCVITLGTPFTGDLRATSAWQLYELLGGEPFDLGTLGAGLSVPPPVPTTSIYSRTDGVVSWRCCIEQAGPFAESIEVESSHMGLCVNAAALYAIADRLAVPEGRWRPFDRSGCKQAFYGRPAGL